MRWYVALAQLLLLALLRSRWLGYNSVLRTRAIDYFLRCVTPTPMTSAGGSGVAGAITVKLHTGDPGSAGTLLEVTGGSYAPQNATFSAGSSGTAALSADVPFAGMPAVTVSHVSFWDKAGTPLFIGGFALTASQTIGTAGATFTLTAAGTSGTVS